MEKYISPKTLVYIIDTDLRICSSSTIGVSTNETKGGYFDAKERGGFDESQGDNGGWSEHLW